LIRRLILGMVCALLALPVAAQSGEVIDLGGGYEIELAEGWTVPSDDFVPFYAMNEALEAVVVIHETGLEALLVSPLTVEAVLPDIATTDLEEALIALLAFSYEVTEPGDSIYTTDLGNVAGLRWNYIDEVSLEDAVLAGDLYLIPLTDGGFLFADIYTYQSYFEEDLDTLLAATEDLFVTAGAIELEPEPEPEASACFVSAETDDSAQLRVGPGYNRSVFGFLAADGEYTVTGQFVDDAGDVWYQLDKDEVAPDAAANELWVAQVEVFESGDCTAVAEADAPPIRGAAPQIQPVEGGGDGGDVTAPSGGSWVLTIAESGLASCLGSETVSLSASETLGQTSFPTDLEPNGEGFNALGTYFGPNGAGGFNGRLDDVSGESLGLRLFPQGDGFMTGSMVFNYSAPDGRGCSATFDVTFSAQ
jgi:hypothetical protein